MPSVNPVRALRHGEEGLAVGSFDTDDHKVAPVPEYRSGIEGGVYAETLHQEWVGGWVKVVPPFKWCVFRREDGPGITAIYTVTLKRGVFGSYKFRVLFLQQGKPFVEYHYTSVPSFLFNALNSLGVSPLRALKCLLKLEMLLYPHI